MGLSEREREGGEGRLAQGLLVSFIVEGGCEPSPSQTVVVCGLKQAGLYSCFLQLPCLCLFTKLASSQTFLPCPFLRFYIHG